MARWTFRKLSPVEAVAKAKATRGAERQGYTCGMLGLFGGEPTLHPEFIVEAGRLCREAGCVSKMHTNGYVSEEVFRKILGAVDIVSINIKPNYERMGVGDASVILRNIEQSWKTLGDKTVLRYIVGPDLLPTEDEISKLSRFLCERVSPSIVILVEVAFQPVDCFPEDQCGPPFPGEEDYYLSYARSRWVGLYMLENGLERVQVRHPMLPIHELFHLPRMSLGHAISDKKPTRPFTELDLRMAKAEFSRRHSSLEDGLLFQPRDIAVALACGIEPEDVLRLDPRVYESWGI